MRNSWGRLFECWPPGAQPGAVGLVVEPGFDDEAAARPSLWGAATGAIARGPAPATAGYAAAALQIRAVPFPLRALVVTSLSSPECLPLLLSHLSAACTSHDRSDATVSVPAAAGPPGTPPATGAPSVFPICMAHLLVRGVFLGWGLGGQLQLRIPEGGFASVRGTAEGITGAGPFANARPVSAPDDGSRHGASERGLGGCPGD